MSRMLSALQRIEAKSAGEESPSPEDPRRTQPLKTEKPRGADEPAADGAEAAEQETSGAASEDRPAESATVEQETSPPEAEPASPSHQPSEADRLPGTLEKVARLVDLAQKENGGGDVPEDPPAPTTESQGSTAGAEAAPDAPPEKGAVTPESPPATVSPPRQTAEPPDESAKDADQPAVKAVPETGSPTPTETPPRAPASPPAPIQLAPHWHRLAEAVLSQWAGREPVVLMFSSPEENESRAAAAVSLAAALAAAAPEDVLLVDANLCEPALAGRLGVVPGRSLADVLNGTAPWQDVVRPTCVRGLTLLPARAAVTDASVHLRALGPVIEELRRRYRFVLVAATSIGYGETAAIARWCDGVYLWIRLNKTPCRTALEAINMIERHGGQVAGCVLAEVPSS